MSRIPPKTSFFYAYISVTVAFSRVIPVLRLTLKCSFTPSKLRFFRSASNFKTAFVTQLLQNKRAKKTYWRLSKSLNFLSLIVELWVKFSNFAVRIVLL